MADSRAYEIQLVETLRSIGRALGASGISSGGSSSSSSSSTNLGDVVTALNGVNSRLDTVKFYLDNLSEKVTYDQELDAWHLNGSLYADGFVSAGGVGTGGDEPGYLSEMWISLKGNSDSFANEKINPYHIPIGDGLAIDTSTNPYTIKVVSQGTVTAVAIGSGSPISPVNGVITLPTASSISASEQGLVKGSLLYSALGDAFDSSNSVKDFVNSSIATATATYRGSYNVVSDLGGHYDDSEATIAAALATKMASLDPPIVPDNNDYCYVPIPTSDSTPTQIARVDRYKYNDDDEEWAYEYTLNNSGYTAAQWAAINSQITGDKVSTYDTVAGYFTQGVLSVTHGGTGLSSINEYSLIYASATNTFSALAPNTSSTKKFLSMTGVAGSGNTPAWSTVSVTDVIGTTAIGSDSMPVYYSGSAFATITSLDLLSKTPGVVKAKKFYLDAETYFELDSNNNVKLVVRSGKGFYTEGFVTAGGVGSGGGGGGSANLLDVWTSMQNTNTDTDYNNWKIHKNHLPDITANNGLSAQYGTHSGTGQSMTSTLTIGVNSGYKLPTTTEWGNKAEASALAGYLPLNGGTLTGTLSVATGYGISDAGGNGVLVYHPTSWTGVANTQWGVGATDCQGVIRSSNSDLIHYRGGTSYSIYDESNANSTSVAWSARSLSLNSSYGTITGATNIDSLLYFDTTNSRVGIGASSPSYKFDVAGDIHSNSSVIANGCQFGYIEVPSGQNIINSVSGYTLYLNYTRGDNVSIAYGGGQVGIGTHSYKSGAKLTVAGVAYASTGIYSDGYVTSGAAASSSDRAMKDNILRVTPCKAKSIIMSLYPSEWIWNDKNEYLRGKRGAGLISQEVEPILDYAVLKEGKYQSLNYNVLHAFEIALAQDHESRIEKLEKENKMLKEEIKKKS